MRIIAGQWRSRRLVRPGAQTTRPAPDRVREAVFDILGSYYECPGALPPLRVADVFAGSGSMGLEALSRGAGSCCFFERDRAALKALRQNLDTLCVGAAGTIVTRDAWQAAPAGPDGRPFDLILLDPPYADSDDTSDTGRVRRYLAMIAPGAGAPPLVLLHHRAKVRYTLSPEDRWEIADHRTFGTNSISMFVQ